jgi:hypothetical protein
VFVVNVDSILKCVAERSKAEEEVVDVVDDRKRFVSSRG